MIYIILILIYIIVINYIQSKSREKAWKNLFERLEGICAEPINNSKDKTAEQIVFNNIAKDVGLSLDLIRKTDWNVLVGYFDAKEQLKISQMNIFKRILYKIQQLKINKTFEKRFELTTSEEINKKIEKFIKEK